MSYESYESDGGHSPAVFVDLLVAGSDREAVLMKQAASMSDNAVAKIVCQGTEEEIIQVGTAVYGDHLTKKRTALSGRLFATASRLDPEVGQGLADRALRNGGAIVRLTIIAEPNSTKRADEEFNDNLNLLRKLVTQV
jgi:hypothetical protein